MSQPADLPYDFFIAHAGPDTPKAERLFDLLAQETRVFLDSKSLMLGDDWDRMLSEAQRGSRVTVVLISNNTDEAFYQREEIAAAINLARKSEAVHRVVPVYLDPPSDTIPYGLRLKHGLTVSDQLPVENVATRLVDLHRMLTPRAASIPERVAKLEPDVGGSASELADRLFDRDPVVSLPAVVRLAELGPAILPSVFAKMSGLDVVTTATVRALLRRFPDESAPFMVDLILGAHRDWHRASPVPGCFTPEHRPFAAETLAGHLDDSKPDVVRMCIESLGFMAAETWGYRLVELLLESSDYAYSKYEYYVVLARARMLVHMEADAIDTQWRVPSAFADLEKLIGEISRRGWRSFTHSHLRDVLARCEARHADHLIASWLTSHLRKLRTLAASSLGQMRLHRSLSYLVDRAGDSTEEQEVVHEAAFALGNIGGTDAVDALEQLLSSSGGQGDRARLFRWALAHCVADAGDDRQFDRLARDILAHPPSEVCWVHRAIGVRRDDRFEAELRSGLQSTDPLVRGQSALALARLRGAEPRDKVIRAYQEAASPPERILAVLALLVAGEAPPDDIELVGLREQLARQSYSYKRLIKDDILEVLTESGHPQGPAIAEAWRGVYAMGLDY
ncbi:MAG TPA: TIR domain-containing protein [Actinomycetes bacterium]|nr:TIR domain-containing protein [Actinomycetes bacterium]